MHKRIAVYPGSFDPVTNGHLDIMIRALRTFDRVIVAVARNSEKSSLFTINERIEMIRKVMAHEERLQVDSFEGLLVDYVISQNAETILRGLRAVSDFEYEFQLAQMNHTVKPQVETLFMITAVPYGYLSSSIVKEVASYRGNIDAFVPPLVKEALEAKFGKHSEDNI
ncbi:MAG: pantetheine-phosphate adenylyltransferase [Desulfuromonadales bacterium]|nr:pantetheine-phosphate adenylyltransferase [Desulfuromonadales bacterium]